MMTKHRARKLFRSMACLSAAGTLVASSCSVEELQAVVVGLEAAAQQLAANDRDNDISFGDWILMELED